VIVVLLVGAVAGAAAAEEAGQEGAEERTEGGRRGGYDGDVGFDDRERDGDVVVGIFVAWSEVEELNDAAEPDDADDCDAGGGE
jgi:hypothetical protein